MNRLTGGVLAALAVAMLVFAGANRQTPQQLNEEACGKYKEADADMNQAYQQVLKQYQKDALFIPKFRAAQRAWVAFRDAHLAAAYPNAAPGAYGGVNPMCRCAILTQLTMARTGQLREWLDGTQEGDVCAGSIRINK